MNWLGWSLYFTALAVAAWLMYRYDKKHPVPDISDWGDDEQTAPVVGFVENALGPYSVKAHPPPWQWTPQRTYAAQRLIDDEFQGSLPVGLVDLFTLDEEAR